MEQKTLMPNQKTLLTARDGDQLLRSGSIRVFLVPFQSGTSLRQMYLGTAMVGDVIPAPEKGEGQERDYRILCIAQESSVLMNLSERQGAVEAYAEGSVFALAREFAPEKRHVGRKDFWRTVTERYDQWSDERIKWTEKEKELQETRKHLIREGIRTLFHDQMMKEISASEKTGNPLYDAMTFLCRRCGVTIAPYRQVVKLSGMQIEDMARISGFTCREAELDGKWSRWTDEPFLAELHEEGTGNARWIVCFRRMGMRCIYDPQAQSIRRLTDADKEKIGKRVWTLLRPFEQKPVTLRSVVQFCAKSVSVLDILVYLLTMFLVTRIGIALSTLSRIIYDTAIPQSDGSLALAMGSIFLVSLVASIMFSVCQNLTMTRITLKLKYAMQTAVYDRAFHMPESYYRGQEHAAVAYRIYHLSEMYVMVIQSTVQIVTQLLFSLMYVRTMFANAPQLAAMGLVLVAFEIAVTAVQSILARKLSMKSMGHLMGIRSFLYQCLSGVLTLRSSGAEVHATYRYMKKEEEMADTRRRTDNLNRWRNTVFAFLNGVGLILFYGTMGNGRNLSMGYFMGFLMANNLFSSAILQTTASIVSLFTMLPMLKSSGGVLKEIPEKAGSGKVPLDMKGDIVVSHVSYSYQSKGGNRVIQDLSVHIEPGEYIGIAGHSGCGKSTLVRLLLGFEKPAMGQIYYDGVPMDRLDHAELRRRMGTVLQDGCLLAGTIRENVRIYRPGITDEDIWDALETAGIREEIEAMPLGLMTPVSEESMTISGGQKQRLLIARAILGKPKVLILDEATSSLDNVTQETVIRNLGKLSVTRIAVAHRLSTLRSCDRILVMDNGTIVEMGDWDTLMNRKGRFYEMVQIQQAV